MAGIFKDGLATIKLNDRWGIIDKMGKEIVLPKYDEINDYDGFPAIVALNKKYGFIDNTGNEIIPPKYDAVRNFNEGMTAAQLNGKWGIIDKTGKIIAPFKYSYTDYQSGRVDQSGRFIVFSEGLLRVAIGDVKWDSGEWYGGRWGFVDKTGKEVILLKYDYATPFSEGRAEVILQDKTFYIDKTGKEVK
jgi:hypothetical protein